LASSAVSAACIPSCVRGLACLAARKPVEAVGEFQRILDHPSIVLVDPMDAMARLQLARALVLSGDAGKAKGVYSDLLTLWKNADPGMTVLKEARALRATPISGAILYGSLAGSLQDRTRLSSSQRP